MRRWLVALLFGWWALFAWHPQGKPPSWLLAGEFQTRQECEEYGRAQSYPFEFVRCLQLPDAPDPVNPRQTSRLDRACGIC